MAPLRARLAARLRLVPKDLLLIGLQGGVLLFFVLWLAPRWGIVEAALVGLAMLTFAVALTTASLVRLMLNLMVKQVELFANLLHPAGARRQSAKDWAKAKRVRLR